MLLVSHVRSTWQLKLSVYRKPPIHELATCKTKGRIGATPLQPAIVIDHLWRGNLITFFNITSLIIIANHQSINSFLEVLERISTSEWNRGTFQLWGMPCNVTHKKFSETLPSVWCYGGWQPYCISLDEKLVARESPGVDSVELPSWSIPGYVGKLL